MLSAAADSDSKPEKQAINKLTERLPARSSEAIEGGHEGGEKGHSEEQILRALR